MTEESGSRLKAKRGGDKKKMQIKSRERSNQKRETGGYAKRE